MLKMKRQTRNGKKFKTIFFAYSFLFFRDPKIFFFQKCFKSTTTIMMTTTTTTMTIEFLPQTKSRFHPIVVVGCTLFLKKWAILGLFYVFSSSQTIISILTTNKCEKMSIQYMALGFELTTFGT